MTSVTLLPPQDPQYIQQALTHVLLMDAVVGTLQTPSAIYAASKLSYFDKMKTESKTSTRVTASHVLSAAVTSSVSSGLSDVSFCAFTPSLAYPTGFCASPQPPI